jgi:hypothetical protein
MPLHNVNLAQSFSIDESFMDDSSGGGGDSSFNLKAKVMYDYVAKGADEISVFANEV